MKDELDEELVDVEVLEFEGVVVVSLLLAIVDEVLEPTTRVGLPLVVADNVIEPLMLTDTLEANSA